MYNNIYIEVFQGVVYTLSSSGKKAHTADLSVTLCGAYGAGNLGDETMLRCVITALREHCPDIGVSVISRSPADTSRIYGVRGIDRFDLASLISSLKNSDALIFGGGTLLQTATSRRSLYYYLAVMSLAKRAGCPVVFWGSGAGPVSEKDEARMAKALTRNADILCMRDIMSLEYLKSLGVPEELLVLSADPVFSVNSPEKVFRQPETVCFCINSRADEDSLGIMQKAVCAAENAGLKTAFVCMNKADRVLTEKLFPEREILPELSAEELSAVLGGMRCVVSMRLHALVLADIGAAPCVAVGDDPKLEGFIKYADCGLCVKLSELSPEAVLTAVLNAKPADKETTKKLVCAEKESIRSALRVIERKYE